MSRSNHKQKIENLMSHSLVSSSFLLSAFVRKCVCSGAFQDMDSRKETTGQKIAQEEKMERKNRMHAQLMLMILLAPGMTCRP